MKKVIITSAVAIYFLIGCSFSTEHTDSKDKFGKTTPQSLYDRIKISSYESLKEEIKSGQISDLNILNSEGKSPLDAAIERGSSNIIKLLIDSGASPFKPNRLGYSYYTSSYSPLIFESSNPFNNQFGITKQELRQKSSNTAKVLSSTNSWKKIIDAVNNYAISCDGVLDFLTQIPVSKRAMSISDFISKASSCKNSIKVETIRPIFQREYESFVDRTFSDVSEITSMMKVIPKEFYLIGLEDKKGGHYFLHPGQLTSSLSVHNNARAMAAATEIFKLCSPDDIALYYNWVDATTKEVKSIYIASLKSKVDESTISEVAIAIKDHFAGYLNNEASK